VTDALEAVIAADDPLASRLVLAVAEQILTDDDPADDPTQAGGTGSRRDGAAGAGGMVVGHDAAPLHRSRRRELALAEYERVYG